MSTFADLGLSKTVLAAVESLGYSEPTPVQAQAIPVVLDRRDVIAAAKTGTGKTAAFSLPALDMLEKAKRPKSPSMLVITPTRELAMQIAEVCSTIADKTSHRIATVVGGVAVNPQITRLAKGVDVLIATPGRLIDLMNQKGRRPGKRHHAYSRRGRPHARHGISPLREAHSLRNARKKANAPVFSNRGQIHHGSSRLNAPRSGLGSNSRQGRRRPTPSINSSPRFLMR